LYLAGFLSCILALLVIVAVFLPRFIDLKPIKEKISTTVYEKTGVKIELGSLDIRILPRPRATVLKGSFSLPGKFSGTVESLTLIPHILPLLWGDIAIAELRVEGPQVRVAFPEARESENDRTSQTTPYHIEDLLPMAPALAWASAAAEEGEFFIRIDQGSISISETAERPLRFTDIKTRVQVHPERFDVGLTCASDLWESASFQVSVEHGGPAAKGEVSLKGFKLHELAGYGIHPVLRDLGESEINLDLSFSADELRHIKAKFAGSAPLLTVKRDTDSVELKADRFEGTITQESHTTNVSLTRLNLAHPRIDVTGSLTVDSAVPSAQTELHGENADATAIRDTALALWGDKETTRKIFNVVRGGHVPEISFDAKGASLADLGKTENFVIKGSMEEGLIHIPNVLLDVEHARGSVVIAGGILDGKDLEGTTNGSHGRDGILKLGLKRDEDDDAPFHLDIAIDADLAQLPPVLERVVKNEPFLHEMAQIRDPKGRALGRMILGERLKSVQTKVDVGKFNLEGRYDRVPYDLALSGEAFLFENTLVAARSLSGRVGKSSLAGADVSIDWGENGSISVSSPSSALIHADEMFPWLTSFNPIKRALQEFQDIKGSLSMDGLSLDGPLRDPAKWQFQTKGRVESFVMKASFFPAPTTISSGEFEADQNKLSLKSCRTSLLDASLVVSGDLTGYLGGRFIKDLTIEGTVGEAANKWISNLVSLPPTLRVLSPVAIQQSHLVWDKEGNTAFSGAMGVQNGPRFSIDLEKSPKGLSINRLTISDKNSNGVLSFKLEEYQLDLGFSGTLNRSSLDKLLVRNELLTGSMEGSFKSVIHRSQMGKSTAEGKLRLSGVAYQYGLDEPVMIENAVLTASGSKLQVVSGLLGWRNNSLNVEGSIDATANSFRMDLNVSAPELLWEKPAREQGAVAPQPSSSKERPKYLGVSLDGIVRLKLDSFTHSKLTWKPVFANVLVHSEGLSIDVIEARLCSIPTLGKIEITPDSTRVDIKLAANNQDLDSTLTCLWNKRDFMTGKFRLTGEMTAKGAQQQLADTIRGTDLDLHVEGGRIYRLGVLTKIFAVLNFTELYRGEVPNLMDDGFAYETLQAEGVVENGKLTVKNALLSAPSMRMAGQGEIDLDKKTVDMTLIVAPLRTVDKIVNKVPFFNRVLGGTLVSIPVRVSGDLQDPKVTPLSPSAVGSELLGFVKRAFKYPVQLMEPMWK
jgi:hypothetical protein